MAPSFEQLMLDIYNASFAQYKYQGEVIKKLAYTQITEKDLGDSIKVTLPTEATVSKYDTDNIGESEKIGADTIEIKINNRVKVHFSIRDEDKRRILALPKHEQLKSLAMTMKNSIDKTVYMADQNLGTLYTRAGIFEDQSDKVATPQYVKGMFAYMAAKFQRGGTSDGKTAWENGQMLAVLPPELVQLCGFNPWFMTTETGLKQVRTGVLGNLSGWDIMSTSATPVVNATNNVHASLFGIKGKSLVAVESKGLLSAETYRPQQEFATAFKGYKVYDGGVPRADRFGAFLMKSPADFSAFVNLDATAQTQV